MHVATELAQSPEPSREASTSTAESWEYGQPCQPAATSPSTVSTSASNRIDSLTSRRDSSFFATRDQSVALDEHPLAVLAGSPTYSRRADTETTIAPSSLDSSTRTPAQRPVPWPVTATCSQADYSAMLRMGFPFSSVASVADAERAARAKLEEDETLRERRWHRRCRGVPMLAGAGPAVVEELRRLARRPKHGGIPRSLRAVMWLTLTGMAQKLDENEYFCASLLRRNGYVEGRDAAAITADLERTFPGHPYFSDKDVGIYKLRNLLHALCWRNPLLNYCQSFNYIAAFLLLVLDDEERAFWMTTYILETLLPNDYFGESLMGARVDQAVLELLVRARLPRVAEAVSRIHNFEVSAVLPPWVMALYVNTFPVETTLRVWDYMLTETPDVMSKTAAHLEIALAVLKLNERALATCEDAGDAMLVLRRGTEALFDADLLINTARGLSVSPAELHALRRQLRPAVAREILQSEENRTAMREHRVAQECRRTHLAEAGAAARGSESPRLSVEVEMSCLSTAATVSSPMYSVPHHTEADA